MRRYGNWAGNPDGKPEDTTRCKAEVRGDNAWPTYRQCGRRRIDGLGGFCRQHSMMHAKGRRVSVPPEEPAQ